MIIDAHTHGLHGDYINLLEKAGGDWAKQKLTGLRIQSEDRPQFFDYVYRLEQINRYGIDFQVITPGASLLDPNLCPGNACTKLGYAKAINDNLAHFMEDSKGRLIGIGVVPLLNFDEATRKEMERAINGLGLKGMNVPSNICGKPLDSAEFEPFWAQAEAMDIPVYIHPRNPPVIKIVFTRMNTI